MEAIDLKINNWVAFEGSPCTVIQIKRDLKSSTIYGNDYILELLEYGMCYNTGLVSNKKVFPIYCTEEWLTNFGFINYNNSLIIVLHEEFKFKKYIQYYSENFFLVVEGIDNYSIPLKIKYVHELQNYYYGEISKELKLIDRKFMIKS